MKFFFAIWLSWFLAYIWSERHLKFVPSFPYHPSFRFYARCESVAPNISIFPMTWCIHHKFWHNLLLILDLDKSSNFVHGQQFHFTKDNSKILYYWLLQHLKVVNIIDKFSFKKKLFKMDKFWPEFRRIRIYPFRIFFFFFSKGKLRYTTNIWVNIKEK